jgi:tetrahydromethanopterin S-methyltransferase subunit C
MAFAGINYLAVLVAAVAGFAFGALWYSLLGRHWMAAVGMTDKPKPSPMPFVIALLCQLVMAWVLAGVIGHLGDITVLRSLISAGFLWLGFVITTMMVNHRFQSARWSLTLIDGAYWLGVLLVMGLVIGLFGV